MTKGHILVFCMLIFSIYTITEARSVISLLRPLPLSLCAICLPFLVSQKKEKKLCYFRVKILHPLKALISLGRKPIACMLAFSGGARDKMKGGRAIVNIFFLENRKIPASVTVYMPSLTSQP